MKTIKLESGQRLTAHESDECVGRNCCIHNPSEHSLSTAPRYWRADRGIMERICEHGVGHPDKDDYQFNLNRGYDIGVHGCCEAGCCI